MQTIDELLKASPRDVLDELEITHTQKEEIERREILLTQLLEMMFQRGGDAAAALWTMRTDLPIGPVRFQILQVLLSGARDQVWLPLEVHQAMVERGNTKVTVDNTRVTMGRMADKGELERSPSPNDPSINIFRLPSTAWEATE
jgi:hypothetical protein